MTKNRYIHHPVNPTPWGVKILRARLSLRETQMEFSKRFRVSHITIHNWEAGKTLYPQRIHKEIMDTLEKRLKGDGLWVPEAILQTVLRETLERKGDATI